MSTEDDTLSEFSSSATGVNAPASSEALRLSSLRQMRARWERVTRIVLAGTRNDLDVSQRELAIRLGWTRNMIANLEAGRRGVRLSDFLLIATALNISPDTLLQRILRWGLSERRDSGRF